MQGEANAVVRAWSHLLGAQALPLGPHQRRRLRFRPFGGGQVVEALEDGVDERPAGLVGGGRLRDAVDRAEPVQQRAGLEVRGPRR